MRARFGLVACAVSVALLAIGTPARGQVVRGHLSDATTGSFVTDALLRVVAADNALVMSTRTDSVGNFSFNLNAPGLYRIRAERVGFRPIISDPLSLDASDTLDVHIRLSPQVVLLDSVQVLSPGRRRQRAFLREYYERAQLKTFGTFITREEIDRAHPLHTSDLLRTVSGIQLRPARLGAGSIVTLRGGCMPTLYIDGVRAFATGMTMDELVSARDLEGIEVYKSVAEAPPQYQGLQAGCAVILVWTRID